MTTLSWFVVACASAVAGCDDGGETGSGGSGTGAGGEAAATTTSTDAVTTTTTSATASTTSGVTTSSTGSGGDPSGGGGEGGGTTCTLPPPPPADCEAPEDFDGYTRHVCNVPKGKLAGTNLVDVYQPDGATNAPVVFFVHGGGFVGGTRRDAVAPLARYASMGYVVVSIDYTLRPSNALGVPTDPIQSVDEMDYQYDAAAELAWTRAHVADFGGNPDDVVLMGHSAGGAIVSLLAAQQSWIRDELVENDLICPEDVAGFHTNQVIRGVVNLSGPVDFDLWTYDWAQPLFESGFSPAMRIEASPLTWLEKDASIPPFLIVVGGGAGVFHDPPGLYQGHDAFVHTARDLGYRATLIQPLITKKAAGFSWPWDSLNGKWCFAQMDHVGALNGTEATQLPFALDQVYDEDVYGVCNQLATGGQWGSQSVERAAVDAFIADPTALVPWAEGPEYGHASIPDQDTSPLLLHLGGGPVPTDAGVAWSGVLPAPGVFDGARDLIGAAIDPAGITSANGAPVPLGVLSVQGISFGSGQTMTVSRPVPNGTYEVRAYFADGNVSRVMDITAEGVLIGDDVSTYGGAPIVAKVEVLDTVTVTDGSIDLVFSSTQGVRIAAIELVPAP
ncbi:MAG: alpha/beta fold hydrolase [Polyangiaceae bacterium]|nr:alpha/beta fold hydrolase [Polyangiaceae bacterium]